MSIKHQPTIERCEQLRADILAVIANLHEFAELLPEATDGSHYGHNGPLEDLRECLREATVCADTYFEGVGWDKRRPSRSCVPGACQKTLRILAKSA